MSAGQAKPGLIVPRQSEPGWLKSLHGMAVFAPVVVRQAGKLALVDIGVTVFACCLLDLEEGIGALGNVALRAKHRHMAPFQRVLCFGVLFDAEERGFEPLHVMASGAFPTIGPPCELPAMRVGFVAVGAFLKRQWLLEIAAVVTFHARD